MQKRHNFFQLGVALALSLVLLGLTIPGLAWAVDLLVNGQFEQFQSYGQEWRGFPERYGQGWSVRVIEGEEDLHLMDTDTYGRFIAAVFGLPYLNYHLEGALAQNAASRRAYNFVLSQTVSTQLGQDYTFGGKIVTFWKGPGPEVDHTKIFKRIGLDPTGGGAYDGPNVIWTDWDSLDNAWTSPALAARAEAGQMTVFIQVNNTGADVGPAHLNTTYIDSFRFEQAPIASLTLPGVAPPGPLAVSWDVQIPDPGYWSLWGYDVQVRDETVGTWQTLQEHSGGNGKNKNYTFNSEPGKAYTFRVRAWQQRGPGGDAVITALPGLWVEKSVTTGQAVVGRVINHAGLGIPGVTIRASGVPGPATSGSNGRYTLPTGADGTFEVQAEDFDGLAAPPASSVNVTSAAQTDLTITMRPTGPNQAIRNGDFETDTSQWRHSGGSAVIILIGDNGHSGGGSMLLNSGISVFQTNTVTSMYNPLLSFWYKSEVPMTVQILGTEALNPVREEVAGPVSEWSHFIMEWELQQDYTGPIGARLTPDAGGKVFIDEVSLGPGMHPAYLPEITKGD